MQMNRLKEKWGIKSNLQLFVILLVFSITGSLSIWIAKPVLNLFSIEEELLSPWFFWPLRLFVIFPIYQVLILLVGCIFGQFNFFWSFEKKMLIRLGFKQFKDNK